MKLILRKLDLFDFDDLLVVLIVVSVFKVCYYELHYRFVGDSILFLILLYHVVSI